MAIKVADLAASLRLDTSGFTAGVASAKASLNTFTKGAEESARKAKSVGRSMTMRLTAPIVGVGTAVVATAANYESSMNRVAALTQATGESMEAMEDQAKELGRTTMFSASQAADGMSFLAQAGFEANDIVEAMPGVLDLAAAGQLGLAQAADISSNVLTGFGESASEANRVSDLLAAASINANTNVSQLGEAMKFVAPVAASAGLEMEETAAAIGLLGNAGIQGSMAGTTLRGAIARLLKPSTEAAGTIERLGLNVLDADGNMRPFVEIVQQLEQSGADTADMMEIFGLRAGPGMAALVQQGSEELEVMNEKMRNAGGTAERVAEKQMEGFRGQMLKLKSALEGLAIAVAESGLLEFVTDLATSLTSLVSGLAETNPAVLKMMTVLLGLVAVAGPVTSLFGSLLSGVNAVAGAFGLASVSAGGLLAVLGPIAAGIAALAVTGTIVDHFVNLNVSVEDLTDSLRELNETNEVTGGLAEAFGKDLEGVSDALDNADARTSALGRTFVFLSDVVTAATLGFVSIDTSTEQAIHKFERLDDALVGLASGGSIDAAANGFARIAEETLASGRPIEDLLERLPDLADHLDESGQGADQLALMLRAGVDPAEALERALADVSEAGMNNGRVARAATSRMNAMAEAHGRAVGPMEEAKSALDRVTDSADDASAAMKTTRDRWDALTGRFISEQEALINVEAGFARLKEDVDKATTSLDLQSEAGRTNRQALLDQINTLASYRDSQIEAGVGVDKANANLSTQISRLEDQFVQMGFNREEIRGFIEDTLNIPLSRTTAISTAFDRGGLDEAKRAIMETDVGIIEVPFVADLDELISVRNELQSRGVDTSRIPDFSRFRTGGRLRGPSIVGEDGPELFAPDTTGTVITNDALRRGMAAPAMGEAPVIVQRGGGGSGPRTANITVELDGRQIMRAIGKPLVDEIRLRGSVRTV